MINTFNRHKTSDFFLKIKHVYKIVHVYMYGRLAEWLERVGPGTNLTWLNFFIFIS